MARCGRGMFVAGSVTRLSVWRAAMTRADRSMDAPATPAEPAEKPSDAQLTYRDAGVDIDAGEALVEAIKPLARTTRREGVLGGLGGFGALFDPKAAGFNDPILVSSTDGVGTKLRIAIE